ASLLGTDWHNRWALTCGTDWQHCWAALVGSTGGWHWWAALVGRHRWVALVGTGGWAQVGGTAGAQVCDTAEWHRWVHCWAQVGALLGTGGGCTAGHRWAELVGGTAGHRSSGH
ncbi:unnamed protein product, partial [Staurois parvus]